MERFLPWAFVAWGRPDRRELGRIGEELAARDLAARGWRILARRQRTPWAEIDLVVACSGRVVCVEVKTGRARPASPGDVPPPPRQPGLSRGPGARADPWEPTPWRPAERLSWDALSRQRRAAEHLARAFGGRNRHRENRRGTGEDEVPGGGRVDLIEVLFVPGRLRPRILHHRDLRTPFQVPVAGP